MASGEILPILKEVLVKLTLGRHPLTALVFVASITQFILGLDVLPTHNASMDLRHHVLRLADKEAPLLCPGAWLHSSTCMKGNSEVAAAE
jgi:hypothetical protein